MNSLRPNPVWLLTWFGYLCVVAAQVTLTEVSWAQGTLTFLRTGSGNALVSTNVPLFLPGNAPAEFVEFRFGFSTEEALAPGFFSDAVTAALANTNTLYLPIVTADASGSVWAPGGGGTVPLLPTDVIYQAILYPSTAPQFAFKEAWSVRVPVPQSFQGGSAVFNFDLFDNANAFSSVAWFSDVLVLSVPEPRTGGLVLLGAAGMICFLRRRRV